MDTIIVTNGLLLKNKRTEFIATVSLGDRHIERIFVRHENFPEKKVKWTMGEYVPVNTAQSEQLESMYNQLIK